jgi:dTDP-4-amino-4,6-dideoxygalactose transaminase
MEKLAILGGEPIRTTIDSDWPVYDESEKQALVEVLDSRAWWRSQGNQTLQFEREFAAYHQARHGIAVTNGTAALEVALAALGIGPGDEVIVPDFTFVATASAVLFTGALPVLVDVTPDTYCLDPDMVEGAITRHTRAIIAVHLGGHPADLDRLVKIARTYGLALVEDCAHAHGSEWRGRRVGSIGDVATFSFQSSKLMTAGEGGIILTNRDDLETRVRSIHDCGRLPEEWFYSHFMYGSNYRLSEWQGAVLRRQLTRLDEQTEVRTRSSAWLNLHLPEIHGITPQKQDERCTRNGQYAYIFHYNKTFFAGLPAETFILALEREGFSIQASYPPVHALDLFKNGAYRQRLCPEQANQSNPYRDASYPNTLRGAWETVWLPQPFLLSPLDDIELVHAAICKIQRHAPGLVEHLQAKLEGGY